MEENVEEDSQIEVSQQLASDPGQKRKFGTIAGVFVPTVLTILGVIMYLRLGWVVGNAGLLGAILIILLAHVVTISTGLAVSSIATNIRVGAGGAFSLISQSLGLEVGGSVSIPLYVAQAVSICLYIFGFKEGVQSIFPEVPELVILMGTFLLVFVIAYASATFTSRVQFLILGIVIFSLISIFLGTVMIEEEAGLNSSPVLWGDFEDGSFWQTFAIFFPAVTGIMVGISMSGNLKDPRRSIPIGTMTAIIITMVIYVFLAVWLAGVASVEELLDTGSIVMADKAYWSWAVIAGLLGATFSAALGSMVAAPRVMQALGQHRILPRSPYFAEESSRGEPQHALLVTGIIVFFVLLLAFFGGGLDAIAPLITMFFLLTYSVLNAVVLIEQTLGMVSFRPTLSIPRIVPLIGLLSCVFVMLLVDPIFGVIAIVLTLGIYAYLLRKQLQAPWGDVRSGLFLSIAAWASERASRMPAAPERAWSPRVLAPVDDTKTMTGSYRFLKAITLGQGYIYALGLHPPGQEGKVAGLDELMKAFAADGIYTQTMIMESSDKLDGTRKAIEVLSSDIFRPNIMFLPIFLDDKPIQISDLLEQCIRHRLGIVLLARHPVIELGREQQINIWVREQGPAWQLGMRLSNLDLSVLLAYQLSRVWNGSIALNMVVRDEDTGEKAQAYLSELVTLARLPKSTEVRIMVSSFWEALTQIPAADINFFGLPDEFDPEFARKVFDTVEASCIFVRDSGDESALA